MSAVSTAYDNLRTRVATILTSGDGWFEVPNPYNPAGNSALIQEKGWGIAIGPGQNANRELSCNIHIDRTFTLLICMALHAQDHDADKYASLVKEIYEALFSVTEDFETNDSLNSGLILCNYESDSGIQTFEADKFDFLYVQATFTTRLIETLGD